MPGGRVDAICLIIHIALLRFPLGDNTCHVSSNTNGRRGYFGTALLTVTPLRQAHIYIIIIMVARIALATAKPS